jgi:putative flavoprotein involved in K+ transport
MERQFGAYPSRDQFVAYLERYVDREGLTVRVNSPVVRIDRAAAGWSVILGDEQALSARGVIVATGYDAKPFIPPWPGAGDYTGTLMHAVDYRNSEPFTGREVLVIGAGNTASDVATDLAQSSPRVLVSIRTPPNIFPRRFFGTHAQYGAILGEQLPGVGDRMGFMVQRLLYGDLTKYGLPRPKEGMHAHFRHSGHGPMVDEGFVKLVKNGSIEIVPAVASFDGSNVRLADGRAVRPEVVIAATGYARDLERLVGHLDVLTPNGCPVVDGTRSPPGAAGLYFIGFVRKMGGQLWPMRGEAKRIARELSTVLEHQPRRRACAEEVVVRGSVLPPDASQRFG